MTRRRIWIFLTIASLALAIGAMVIFIPRSIPVDPRLTGLVQHKPFLPVVFTSRSSPASLRPAATRGEGFTYPGQPQWQAREGRLRVLDTDGAVRELTWNRPLPDGSTIIDVMSPSLSVDGRWILFAGRRENRDAGRFRIFRVSIDGTELEPLTGLPGDRGCLRLPPMRYGTAQARLPDDERTTHDYDDIDPVETANGILVFASSRMPDLGGVHDRRATQIWCRPPGQEPRPLSASRANDRWPYILSSGMVAFTLWSHQAEVISEDGTELVTYDGTTPTLTRPPHHWAAVSVTTSGERFGMLVKIPQPIWRGRPTHDGKLLFMTPRPGESQPHPTDGSGNETPETRGMTLGIVEPGLVANAPSSLAVGSQFPLRKEVGLRWAPLRDATGKQWSLATPSASPRGEVIVTAAPMLPDGTAGQYGLAQLNPADWQENSVLQLQPLFDDPELIDAEPVLVYPRDVGVSSLHGPPAPGAPLKLSLFGGRVHEGPLGKIEFKLVHKHDGENGNAPGQTTDTGEQSAVPPFPEGSIKTVVFYSSPRDRFDDPKQPRVSEKLFRLQEYPLSSQGGGSMEGWLPTPDPTLLMGVGADGRVASVEGAADSRGVRGKFYAFAGDHVSGVRANGYHFCTGCHAGHSFAGGTYFPEKQR